MVSGHQGGQEGYGKEQIFRTEATGAEAKMPTPGTLRKSHEAGQTHTKWPPRPALLSERRPLRLTSGAAWRFKGSQAPTQKHCSPPNQAVE